VAYAQNIWGTGSNGFTANIMVTNSGQSTIASGWTLVFGYTGGQRLTPPGWNASFAQPDGSGTVTATGANALASTGSITIGFNGTHTGSTPPPTGFTLNGQTCS
jgi:mannan endo-1,4-beta-mannosidase